MVPTFPFDQGSFAAHSIVSYPSRLSCQARIPEDADLTVEIPKYTLNQVSEGKR